MADEDKKIGQLLSRDILTGTEETAVTDSGNGNYRVSYNTLKNWLNSFFAQSADYTAHVGNASIHFGDAPSNGQQYVRQDGGWVIASSSPVLTTDGDILTYQSGEIRLPVGTAGQVLSVAAGGTSIEWATAAGGGDVIKVGTPVDNQVGVWTGNGTIEGDPNLTFDTTTDTLSTVNIAASGLVDGRDISVDGIKLDAIEPNADVTDATNVAAAGALMAVDVDADITTFSLPANTTITAFGASLVDDTNASEARATLGTIDDAPADSINYVRSDNAWVEEVESPVTGLTAKYQFSTNVTMADPGNGFIRVNNAAMNLATELAVNENTRLLVNVDNVWGSLRSGDVVSLYDETRGSEGLYYILTADPVDNGTWWQMSVTGTGQAFSGQIGDGRNVITSVTWSVGNLARLNESNSFTKAQFVDGTGDADATLGVTETGKTDDATLTAWGGGAELSLRATNPGITAGMWSNWHQTQTQLQLERWNPSTGVVEDSDVIVVEPDGSVVFGGAVGGGQGPGTINATALLINGVSVGTGGGDVFKGVPFADGELLAVQSNVAGSIQSTGFTTASFAPVAHVGAGGLSEHPAFTVSVPGFVPAPGAGSGTRVLQEDGLWVEPSAGGGIPEAPVGGGSYVRRGSDTSWQLGYTQTEADAAFTSAAHAGDATIHFTVSSIDHNGIANLTVGDPHTQYLNNARGDARYAPIAHVGTGGTEHPTFTAAINGFVPASGGGVTNFLRADGTWAEPSAPTTATFYTTHTYALDSLADGASTLVPFYADVVAGQVVTLEAATFRLAGGTATFEVRVKGVAQAFTTAAGTTLTPSATAARDTVSAPPNLAQLDDLDVNVLTATSATGLSVTLTFQHVVTLS